MKDARPIALSIVVPCYKAEQYLCRCLDSLVNQTLEDIELICINDGSPDSSIDILRDYEARYPDKVVVVDKDNEGTWRARWDGIAIARGEYIGFLDSDDCAMPDFAERLYAAAKQNDADIAVCGFDRIELDTSKRLSREMAAPRSSFIIDEDPGRLVELNGAPWNKCFRADILKNMRNLENPPAVLEDIAFHLLAYCDMHGKVVFVSDALVHYMVRAGSAINSVHEELLSPIFDAFLCIRGCYKEGRPELLDMLDAVAFLHLGVSLVFRLSCSKDVNIQTAISDMTVYLDDNFPTWRKSPYINWSYARSRGGSLLKLLAVQKVFKAHFMPAFLWVYRFMIDKLHVDIKW